MSGGTTEVALETSPLPGSRPYRSHKIRACDVCRARKARCEVPLLGEACQLCRDQRKVCQYSNPKSFPTYQRPVNALGELCIPKSSSLKRNHGTMKTPETPETCGSPSVQKQMWRPPQISQGTHRKNNSEDGDEDRCQSLHIVGPAVSSDAHVLEQYMSPAIPEGRTDDNPYQVYCSDPSRPVLYKKVRKGRAGLSINKNPGIKELEILEQILYPHACQLREL